MVGLDKTERSEDLDIWVLAVFRSFYDGSIDLTRINRAFLVLLPKTDYATHPSQFRPISLQNAS
jgi:hypothetical protein